MANPEHLAILKQGVEVWNFHESFCELSFTFSEAVIK
jgi:hypothetical protein